MRFKELSKWINDKYKLSCKFTLRFTRLTSTCLSGLVVTSWPLVPKVGSSSPALGIPFY